MLSDHQIRAQRWQGLDIEGYEDHHIQPASYDVRLHRRLLVLQDSQEALDPKTDTADQWIPHDIDPDLGFVLRLGDCVLGSTIERFRFPTHLGGQLQGKSSLGRLGVNVHATAGFIDPGFCGQVTLELFCVHHRGVILYPGMPIGQISFTPVDHVVEPYRGKYVDQEGPTASRYHLNWIDGDWR